MVEKDLVILFDNFPCGAAKALFDIQKVSTKPSILPCAASRWGMAI
jgi:hypothetical protein